MSKGLIGKKIGMIGLFTPEGQTPAGNGCPGGARVR